MEERIACKKPASVKGGKKRVAGGEPIADVPVIRIVERIGLDVETVVVPVAVDRPEDALSITLCHPYHP